MSLPITPETKVGALLDAYPDLEHLLIAWVPAFSKLKNPILRRTVAKVATLDQAARVGGISVQELVCKLRAATGQANPELQTSISSDGIQAHESPSWITAERISYSLDADQLLNAGEHPLGKVQQYLALLDPGQIVQLNSSFLPSPLIDYFKLRGLPVYTAEPSPNHYVTYIAAGGSSFLVLAVPLLFSLFHFRIGDTPGSLCDALFYARGGIPRVQTPSRVFLAAVSIAVRRGKVNNLSSMSKDALLKQAPLFADLGPAEINLLAGRTVRKQVSKGETLFCEGDKAHGLYLVETGSMKIYKLSASGREQVLHIERPGSSFAEVPLFDGDPYPASAAALEDSTLLFIEKRVFDELCLLRPQIALTIIRVIGKRLRKLTRLIEEISLKDVSHRLAWWLLERVEEHGVRQGDCVELELTLSHSDIGTRIGTVREVVTRTLSRFEAEGLIAMSGRVIRIPQLSRLRDLAAN